MTNDILDASQKIIDDAAKQADIGAVSTPPPEPEPLPVESETPSASTPPTTTIPTPEPPPTSTPPATNDASTLVESLLETKNPEPVVPPPPQHKKATPKGSPKGPLLALIALLLLILPISVYFISQQNQQIADIRNRASGTTYAGPGDPCGGSNPSCQSGYNCDGGTCHINGWGDPCGTGNECANGYGCTDGTCQPNNPDSSCGRDHDAGAPVCCAQGSSCANRVCEGSNRLECNNGGVHCTIDADGCTDGNPGDDTGDDTAPTPTPTTGTTPVCQNIKIYKGTAQVTNLTTLRAGDAVVFAVKGNLTPAKAHFRVNGGSWTETTTENGSHEWTLNYTIPDGVTEFVIEGEVFTNGAWR